MIVYNPRSGSGRSARCARRAAAALQRADCAVELRDIRQGVQASQLADSTALVVAGGDGSILSCADAAVESGCPVYHLPTGNENLFARMFGMDRDAESLLAALRERRVERIDMARAEVVGQEGGAEFVLMWSAGPDAGVIHRLATMRRRAMGHLAYALPVMIEGFRPMLPTARIEVDGVVLVDGEPGWTIVGNAAEYALRCNFAADASVCDGLLDVVFVPATTTFGCCRALVMARHRTLLRRADVRRACGSEIRIRIERARGVCAQLDGEAVGTAGRAEMDVRLTVAARVLPVLLPAGFNPAETWAMRRCAEPNRACGG